MSIIKATGYRDGAGTIYATLEEAQQAELRQLFHSDDPWRPDELAKALIQHADQVLAILTLSERSRLKARSRPGTTNPKRAAARILRGGKDERAEQLRARSAAHVADDSSAALVPA